MSKQNQFLPTKLIEEKAKLIGRKMAKIVQVTKSKNVVNKTIEKEKILQCLGWD